MKKYASEKSDRLDGGKFQMDFGVIIQQFLNFLFKLMQKIQYKLPILVGSVINSNK